VFDSKHCRGCVAVKVKTSLYLWGCTVSQQYKIFVVEDSRTQAIELKCVLENNNYEVVVAHDGKDAWDRLQSVIPDVILTDIVMPNMNGYELCKAVRANKRTREIPVVLLTSLTSPDDVIEGLKCGADNFITKPFDCECLLSRIHYILLNKQLRQNQPVSLGLSLFFGGKKHVITAERTQILDLFFSSFDATIHKHRQLENTIKELSEAKEYLQDAKQEADLANAARGNFLANVTHDLRTPLVAIVGISELLATTNLDKEQREYVNTIYKAGEGLLLQINNILDFSKIDAGMIELENIDFDLFNQVKSATTLLSRMLNDKKLQLEVNIDPSTPQFINGDEIRLRQIFINLLSNAIKFTQTGKITFNIKTLSSSNDTAKLRFECIDTGIGISPEDQTTLFRRFAQVENKYRTTGGGTGLGLAIVKQLVAAMGGEIQLESAVGKGSKFSFDLTFPISSSTAADEAKTAVQNHCLGAPLPASPTDASVIKILVADDSLVNQTVAANLLRRNNCGYELANNGADACKIYRERGNEFNLVLMDCHMPVMDGFQATAEIRRMEAEMAVAKPIPIIAMTASCASENSKECIVAGMNGFIEKPFNQQKLNDCIQRWVKHSE
jgi:signal transduction histidine kinase